MSWPTTEAAWLEHEERARSDRRDSRAYAALERGLRRRSCNCSICGAFKRRPADRCTRCGDEPLPIGSNAADFNRAYGYAS